jgi:hypothetical protein
MTATATGWAELGFGPGSYVRSGIESSMLRSAIRDGMRNENLLANLVFFHRHPERNCRLISREGDGEDFRRLAGEWLRIRDTQVRPLLGGDSTFEVGGAAAMPRVTAFRFRAADGTTTDPANGCASCPETLGVGRGGTASNGMELRFTLSGHRAGMEYDITRTRRDSLWQRRAGTWAQLGTNPMGTGDDRHDTDEQLSPVSGGHIFVIDTPGWFDVPVPTTEVLGGGELWPGAVVAADAQDAVARFSFAEWVIARHRAEGIPWTPLALPPLADGTARRFIFWRCTVWLTRDGAGRLALNRPRSSIALGSLSHRTITTAP